MAATGPPVPEGNLLEGNLLEGNLLEGRALDVDVLVVGGGPAGSCAALALLRDLPGARVLIVDAGGLGRDKTCGDAVAAETFELAAGLGVVGLAAGYPPVSRLRLVGPGGGVVAHAPARPARVIPRRVLDARLLSAAVTAGAELVHARVRELSRTPSGLTVRTGQGTVTTRLVLGCDGVHSVVRRGCGVPARRPDRTGIAVRGYAPDVPGEQLLISVAAGWPAYAWSFPIGDGRANIGFGVRLDQLPAGDPGYLRRRLGELLPAAAGGLDPRSVRTAHLPFVTGRVHQPDGPVLLAGDAAALVDPLTGEGIWYAAESGRLAGLAAAEALRTGSPERAGGILRRRLRRRLGIHLALAGAAGAATGARPGLVDLAVRATRDDAAAFDQLTEFSLAGGLPGPRLLGRLAAARLHRV